MPEGAFRPACLVVVACLAMTGHASQAPSLDQVLKAGAVYIAEYEKAFSAVVSEEVYTQRVIGEIARAGREERTLKSDLLLMQVRDAGWVTFRDVFEVDGHKVRDRSDRLVSLILKPPADASEQVTRIAEEGARFNLGPIARTLNTPALALMFLRGPAQERSRFRLARVTTIDGQRLAEVEFVETAVPRMVRTVDEAPASGRFWLAPESGRVVRTELTMVSGGSRLKILVTYRMQERIGLLAPVTMEESYELGGGGTIASTAFVAGGSRIEGSATYTNFRMFNVDTATIIKK
jgi:hypothetical protein